MASKDEDDIEQGVEQGIEPSVRFAEDVEKESSEPPEQAPPTSKPDEGSLKTSEGIEMMLYDEAPPTCWSRFRGEWKLKFFVLSETDDAIIDVHRSFAPPPFWNSFLVKAVITGSALAILITDMTNAQWNPVSYYFIYLSHWTLLVTCLYLLASFANTLIGVPEQRPYEDIPSFMVRFAWGLYPTAQVMLVTTTIFFWVLVFDPTESVTVKMVMKHGGLMLLVLVEGLFLNRIPVRQKHLLFPMVFITLYVIWTAFHDLFNLGNPYTDGDAIYEALDWTNQWQQALVTSVILVFVVTPFVFLNVWLLSIWSCPFHFDGLNRHHLFIEQGKEKETQSWWDSIANWTWHRKGEAA